MSTQPAQTIPYYQTGRQQCYRNKRSRDAILSCRVINGGFQLAHVHENWLTLLPHKASLQKKLSWYNTCPSHHHHHRSCWVGDAATMTMTMATVVMLVTAMAAVAVAGIVVGVELSC
ncbi:hypothetical protein EDB87DRAFT_1820302, partial [Lactarius vividus]